MARRRGPAPVIEARVAVHRIDDQQPRYHATTERFGCRNLVERRPIDINGGCARFHVARRATEGKPMPREIAWAQPPYFRAAGATSPRPHALVNGRMGPVESGTPCSLGRPSTPQLLGTHAPTNISAR